MPFVKGVSGNPNGRPRKGDSYTEYIEKAVKKLKSVQKGKDGSVINKYKGKAVLAMALVDLATNKEYPPQIRLQAIKEIIERNDGKAPQYVDMMAKVEKNSEPVLHVFVNDLEPDKEG